VRLAETEGPQTITRDGQSVVVIVAADQFRKTVKPKESILDFFAPLRNSGINLVRDKELPAN